MRMLLKEGTISEVVHGLEFRNLAQPVPLFHNDNANGVIRLKLQQNIGLRRFC
jgi:hypothetical protein